MIYKTIDLCAGIGGIRKGFEMTGGFRNVLSAEIDQKASLTYKHLFGDNALNDLTSESFKKKTEEIKYDVLLAGFPCQTFSRVGKKMGFLDDTRGTIFFEIADIISRTHPKAIFLENVDNLVTHDHGNTINTIINVLENELDYKVIGVEKNEEGGFEYKRASFVRNTKSFGLPQNRPRTYIVAFNRKIYGSAIELLDNKLPTSGNKLHKTLNDILDTDVDEKYYISSGYLETLKRHKERQKSKGNGFGYCVVNSRENAIANSILATGGSGKERNMVYQPKEGLSNIAVSPKKSPPNKEGLRFMTPKEWGRLQGFIDYAFVENGIDTFSFPGGVSEGQQYKQFGNAVSIPVIEAMAEFMLRCFNIMNDHQETIVLQMIKENSCIKKSDVINVLGITANQASYLLRKMRHKQLIKKDKHGRYSCYSAL